MRHTPCGCCPPAAPEARNTSAIAPQCRFLQRRCSCAFGDHIFSLLREKIWKKRALGTRKKHIVTFFVLSLYRWSRNALAGDCQIGFPQRTVCFTCRYVCAR